MNFTKKQYILAFIILLLALISGITIGALSWIIQSTPEITDYKGSTESTQIYSANGELLTRLYKENRVYVPIEKIPNDLKNAIVSIEDSSFYQHHGIDFWGIPRALITNIKAGQIVQGFSTITMQLAENALFTQQERTYYRKIQEIYLALQFERLYTKPEILEMYLNEIFMGHSAYGVQIAAHQYFGKDISELTLSQSALLAGLPKAPNYYSPLRNPEAAKERRNIVLNRMNELGYINNNELKQAKTADLNLKPEDPKQEDFAPYFIRYVRDELIDKFGAQMVYSGGLKVYTTLNTNMQKKAEDSVKNALGNYIPTVKRNNNEQLQPQLSILSLNPKTGAIEAMIGGRGKNDQFNRATQAIRQPGSAFKPFVYTTAIKNNYSTSSLINDMPMIAAEEKGEDKKIWPKNFQDQYRGYVNLRTALTHSINVASVKLLREVGVNETIKTAENMGISTFTPSDNLETHLSLALGGLTNGVKPLEISNAYGILANRGIKVEPYAIKEVLNKNNQIIYEKKPQKKVVLSEETSYIMTDMLQSVVKNGTGWRANFGRPIAGKTGTTNNYTDAWFVGYTPELVTTVWIGEDSPKKMVYDQKDSNGNYIYPEGNGPRTVSSSEAVMLWREYMEKVMKNKPVKDFNEPEEIYHRNIDPITGLLANQYTPNVEEEIFRKENIPSKTDDLHGPVETVRIDTKSGKLATNNCPNENIAEYKYIKESGIRIGATQIKFEELVKDKTNTENSEFEKIEGTYLVDKGEPVQKIDPETGVPLTNSKGQVLYEKKPTQVCPLHNESENNVLDYIRGIWGNGD
ncbi:MAG TPA: PBP1A family penicillin-binding protein [Halanaerobiales bacterium]|nr:PBP1A family penicillin-binding protein [Halanaerobiales bacterium]